MKWTDVTIMDLAWFSLKTVCGLLLAAVILAVPVGLVTVAVAMVIQMVSHHG